MFDFVKLTVGRDWRNVFWRSSAKRREPAPWAAAACIRWWVLWSILAPLAAIWPALYTYLSLSYIYICIFTGIYFLFEIFSFSSRCPWKKGKTKTRPEIRNSLSSSSPLFPSSSSSRKNLFHSLLYKKKTKQPISLFQTWERHIWNEMIPIWLEFKTTLVEMCVMHWLSDFLTQICKLVYLFLSLCVCVCIAKRYQMTCSCQTSVFTQCNVHNFYFDDLRFF